MRLLQGHSGAVRSLAYSPDSRSLASGGDDGKVLLWDLPTGRFQALVGRKIRSAMGGRQERRDPETSAALPNPDNNRAHDDWVRAVVFDSDGRTLATAGWDGKVRLWNVHAHTGREMLDAPNPAVWCLAFSVDRLVLAAGDMNGQITQIRPGNTGAPHRWAAHQAPIRSLLYLPDGRTLISAGHDHSIKLWDADWGEQRGTLGQHPDWICCLALSPDGHTLASGGEDGPIRLWNLTRREQTATLVGHEKRICQLAYSRDGRFLFSGGWDGTIRLWEVVTGQARSTFDFQVGRVQCLALAPDEMTAAAGFGRAGGPDDAGAGGIVIWDLDW